MNTTKRLGLIAIIASILLAVLLVLSLHFGVNDLPEAKETTGIVDLSGNPVSGARISDLTNLSTLPYAMYTPDEFVNTSQNPGVIANEQRVSLNEAPP